MRNMGSLDRILRVIVAAVLAYLAATGAVSGGIVIAAWIVAAIFLVTSLMGFCPAYRLIGVDTCGQR